MSGGPIRSRHLIAIATTALIAAHAAAHASPDPGTAVKPAAARSSGDASVSTASPSGEGDIGASRDGEDGWTRGKLWSLGGLAGLYTGVGVWAYFAWYHGKPRNQTWEWNGDGMFGKRTYAGGSDKLGHFWSTHVITRLTTDLLRAGGWRRLPASLIAGGLSALYFGLIEVKDAYYYEFSVGDLAADLAGTGLGLLMVNRPEIDRLIDFRVQYWPTREYIDGFKDGDVNFVEDYSGQTYLLALHLSGIPGLTEPRWSRPLRYLDLVVGFQSQNYKPEPIDPGAVPSQHLFLGAALNVQAVLEDLYGEPAGRGRARIDHRIFHTIFEYVSPPYTTLRVAEVERSWDQM